MILVILLTSMSYFDSAVLLDEVVLPLEHCVGFPLKRKGKGDAAK